MTNGDFPEAPASITYSVITPKGYPALLTVRDAEYKELAVKMEFMETYFEKKGYKPQVRGNVKKEIEYVKDEKGNPFSCPACKVGKVKIIHSSKGTFYGCDQSKYNPATKGYEGCKFFSTTDPSKQEETQEEIPDDL